MMNSGNSIKRAECNQSYAHNDFAKWLSEIIDTIEFESVLDLCCGNGNQLILYTQKPNIRITGVDSSRKAIDIARKQLGYGTTLIVDDIDDVFYGPVLSDSKLDLISCCYGLYYSQKPEVVLWQMMEHLTDTGTILIVGPYGNNNKAFFSLLSKHFELPEYIVRSSTTFMAEEVLPVLEPFFTVEQQTFVNPVCYPDVDSVMNYWRASTFYRPEYDSDVEGDIKKHFETNKEYIIEKHVMAYIARGLCR